eukprot:Skav208500  [mRNA]  locus=scaffold1658:66831:72825:+ [translate_table: standard]
MDTSSSHVRIPTEWPSRQPEGQHQVPGIDLDGLPHDRPEQLLSFGVDLTDFRAFFNSTEGILSTHTAHLPLLESTQLALTQCVARQDFDRYLIFTDGTSHGWARRHNPWQMEEEGHGDAWAFLVLGETYICPQSSVLTFLGWHSQKVLYGSDAPHHLGTDKIGAESAEKEALAWAALWRLAQNNRTPTTFCVDSTSTAFQADGQYGTGDPGPCYQLLRGVFHALEELLPGRLLQTHHVRSHTGDPWNEMVDVIAKEEARHGPRLPRQDIDMRDEQLAYIAHRMNLGSSILSDLRAALASPHALDRAQVDPLTQNYVRSLHQDTWFYMGEDPDHRRVVTRVGTRPGDSFADVIFGYAWARILTQVEDRLVDRQLLCSYQDVHGLQDSPDEPPGAFQTYSGPTWMDDTCLALTHADPATLERNAQEATSILLDECLAHGMEPNLQAGKTEILFSFQGRGSRAARLRSFGPTASGKALILGEYRSHEVHLVGQYTHLGCTLHHSGCVRAEMRRRLGIAQQAFNQHRRLLYCNRQIKQQKRTALFDSIIMSKLLYGTETWVLHTWAAKSSFHAGLVRLYRRLLGLPHDSHHSDDAILVMGDLLSPTEALRRSRLRYLVTLYQCGRGASWGLLRQDHEWIQLVQEDLLWLWEQLRNASDLPSPATHLHVWEGILRFHPTWWKKLVRRGVSHAIGQRRRLHEVMLLHRGIFEHLQAHGTLEPYAHPPAEELPPETHYGCMACAKRFRTLGGEGAHMFKVHHQVSVLRLLFDGTACPWCLREYHSHSRLKAHLRYSVACRQGLQARRQLCVPAPGSGSRADALLLSQQDGLVPAMQALGPTLPPVPGIEWDPHDVDLADALEASLLDHEDPHLVLQAMTEIISRTSISWTTCRRTLLHLREKLTDADADVVGFPLSALQALLGHLASPSTWSFLQSSTSATTSTAQGISRMDFYDCEAWCVQLAHCSSPWTSTVAIPRAFSSHRILLHAFAGRRRRGDVQWYLDQMAAPDGMVLVTVSLDLVINAEWGDISKPATRQYWTRAAASGQILGFLCGPPCNTWSRARGVALEDPSDCRRAPRVLRHADSPWGDTCLSLRELYQILEANLLLGFALELFLLVALRQGVAVLEHPEAPAEPELVSIWKLPLTNLILQLPGVSLVSFTQGRLGAPSPKPTTLMTLNLPSLPQDLRTWRLTQTNPKAGRLGKNSEGGYHTAPLKEYPPAMCMAIASSFQQAIVKIPLAPEPLDPAFLHRCQSMVVTEMGHFIGPDTAGP